MNLVANLSAAVERQEPATLPRQARGWGAVGVFQPGESARETAGAHLGVERGERPRPVRVGRGAHYAPSFFLNRSESKAGLPLPRVAFIAWPTK